MLQVKDLNLFYGRNQVLHNLNFHLNQGEILGFLGPNGAGKSSTMRILTGYLVPSSGQVIFDGQNIQKAPLLLRKNLGYLPETAPIYPELKVIEYLQWVARIKSCAHVDKDVQEVMGKCGLTPVKNKLIAHLSKGYRQRVGLAQAILGNPKLLILDEPTVGLDPGQIREIRELIRELGKERTILLSTHILPEVELICDRVIIINKGRILADDNVDNLVQRAGRGRHLLRVGFETLNMDELKERLSALKGVHQFDIQTSKDEVIIHVQAEPGKDIRADLSDFVYGLKGKILEFRPVDLSLEQAFVNLVYKQGEA
ncbi:ATP-binding cassette domain-containing protein [Desulfohalobiaceae bacterium Ax17]|uniref:ABC transporter ATP-binding protein n=1 Tax=Desulfovulcanus ferrireducens TaxID=2831190 RepID=UPI00207BC458|nr:ATP-binding cassette domain-containing protein [Desulfovulcanus ferrireducens]MBT8763826.1 ATP-binding cassette domain-containing protein [Desulfovulcanus ferrireducens]